jgi:hypothetical protein
MPTEEVFKVARSAVVEIVTQDKGGSQLDTGTGFFISQQSYSKSSSHK